MECKQEGCTKPVAVKKRGLCRSHYHYWALKNKPRNGPKECTVEGCTKTQYAKNLCHMHYGRLHIHGSVNLPERVVGECKNEDCTNEARIAGWCKKHYNEQWYSKRYGAGPVKSMMETPGYGGLHYRIRCIRGRASDHPCVDCGNTAMDWSLRHDAESLVRHEGGGRMNGTYYSLDIYDYEPRCPDCHKAYDARTGNRRDKRKKVNS